MARRLVVALLVGLTVGLPLVVVAPGAGTAAGAGANGAAEIDEFKGSLQSGVIEVHAIDLAGTGDPKGVRLLAVIAAICVFGVTAAIIRAIVSQRTSGTVTM